MIKKRILILSAILIKLWIACSFIALSPDPTDWGIAIRLAYVIAVMFFSYMALVILRENES